MKKIICQNIWLRWLGMIPLFVVLFVIHGKIMHWNYVSGAILMILGVAVGMYGTELLNYYHVVAEYTEVDGIIYIYTKDKKYIMTNIKEICFLPKNMFGIKYALLSVKLNDLHLKLVSVSNNTDELHRLFDEIIMLNGYLVQEKDIWGNAIDIWSMRNESYE